MRRIVIVAFLICGLLSRAESACDLSDGRDPGDAVFPDVFAQSTDGYQLVAELSNNKARETVLVNEYYSPIYKAGRVEIYRNKEFKVFVYLHGTNESFTVSGFNCEVSDIWGAPIFLEDSAKEWLDYEGEYTVLGPSAALRKGFLAWNASETSVVYLGDVEADRGTMVEKWKRCVRDSTLFYYFSKPTWHNAYNVANLRVPLRFEYVTEDENNDKKIWTLEFFNYQTSLSTPDIMYSVPEGYGCNRTADTDEDVPKLLSTNHLIKGELVYHSTDMEKKIFNFISYFEIAFHYRSEMVAYTHSPWKKGAGDKDGKIDTVPNTRIVWDNTNMIQYVINYAGWKCDIKRDSEYYPRFELPGEGNGNINLLDPDILIETEGFKYLGDKVERGIPVKIFEKQVSPPSFLYDADVAVAIITRVYATPDVTLNTGNQEKESPVRVTLRWFQDNEKTKLLGILVININSYSNDLPFIHEYFNIGMCFRDYDASTWVKLSFPNMGVAPHSLWTSVPKIEEEFMGFLLTHTEANPARVRDILIEVHELEFSVEALILERPPYKIEFDPSDKLEIINWNGSYGIMSEDDCLKKCVDYSNDEEVFVPCQLVSYCGATCYVSTNKKAKTKDNGQCTLYERKIVSQSLPSMDELVRSIRKLVVAEEFSLSFEIEAGDMVKLTTFKAGSFGDSVGDTTDRLVPRLFREGKFKVNMPGMKLIKGDKDKSKPSARYSFGTCLQACLNNPYCETVSFCRRTECILSENYLSDINLDNIVQDNKCAILARNYVQSYNQFPGVVLARSAKKKVENVKTDDGCATYCTKEKTFDCRSFDFCASTGDCLLHATHYLQFKDEGEGVTVKENCTHYSKKYVYDFKKVPGRRAVGDTEVTLRSNSVEECAKECTESGGYECTAFDFCEFAEVIDNKCFIISTNPYEIKTVDRPECSHYVNQRVKVARAPKETRHSTALAGGLGFLFFLIGAVLGVAATYFIAFRYVNKG